MQDTRSLALLQWNLPQASHLSHQIWYSIHIDEHVEHTVFPVSSCPWWSAPFWSGMSSTSIAKLTRLVDIVLNDFEWSAWYTKTISGAKMVLCVVIKSCIHITPRSQMLTCYQDRRCWHESHEHGRYWQHDRRHWHDTEITDAHMRGMNMEDVDMKIADVDIN